MKKIIIIERCGLCPYIQAIPYKRESPPSAKHICSKHDEELFYNNVYDHNSFPNFCDLKENL